jgi:deoxyribonuclease-4
MNRIPVFHFNDTQVPLGASRDRHFHIGEGLIGFEGFRALLAHPDMREKTAILETPGEEADDQRNMQTILAIARGVSGSAEGRAPQIQRS